ncbi:MAG: Fic family protein, partial [Parcubacteria group bacterium GW2011_GWC2_44_17]
DKQEVQGYKELLETVCANYETTPFTENTIKGFHKILLQYSQKDERHLGEYKKHPNTVVAFDANGKQLGIIFKTTEPYLTPKEIQELLERTGAWIRGEDKHRLLIIAEFIVDFLSIHPFQDGNGRLSRILTNFLLLQHGYEFVRFSSLESVIESNKRLYYLALRRSQKDRGKKNETIEPWINFFLDVLVTMTRTLKLKVEDKGISIQISEREQKVLEYVNKHQRVTSTDVMNKYSIGQRAASKILLQMVEKKLLIRQGKGKRDAFYTLNII